MNSCFTCGPREHHSYQERYNWEEDPQNIAVFSVLGFVGVNIKAELEHEGGVSNKIGKTIEHNRDGFTQGDGVDKEERGAYQFYDD